METRQVTEKKVFRLIMNPMRGNTENSVLVAFSYERQKLVDWVESNRALELIEDEGIPSFPCQGKTHIWRKTFNVGSPLEWYNPCNLIGEPNHYGQGISEEWVPMDANFRSDIILLF